MTQADFHHIAVLKNELVDMLNPQPGGVYIDCTGGGGGHAFEVCQRMKGDGLLVILDRDPEAIAHLEHKFSKEVAKGQVKIVKDAFSAIANVTRELNLNHIDGIYADVGISSHQIDSGHRGFAFGKDGPLDMRMDFKHTLRSAADIVNEDPEDELIRIFRFYGEVTFAKPLAILIAKERQRQRIEGTKHLLDLIDQCTRHLRGRNSHAAAQVFQALRIAVNDELNELSILLRDGFSVLSAGGRLCCISFHSLEDRLVKQQFQRLDDKAAMQKVPREFPLQNAEILKVRHQRARIIKPFPEMPSESEIKENPRSRSARLRGVEKLNMKEHDHESA